MRAEEFSLTCGCQAEAAEEGSLKTEQPVKHSFDKEPQRDTKERCQHHTVLFQGRINFWHYFQGFNLNQLKASREEES